MARSYIGQPLPRFEDLRLLRGAGRYTDDFTYPDQLFAAFVRSPHAHARVIRIATAAAERVPGVVAVLTAADYLADGHGDIHHAAPPTDALNPRNPAFDYTHGQTPLDEPQPVFATERVRHVGEIVAMVIAESAAEAQDAVDLVDVQYADLLLDESVALDGEHGDRAATEAAFAAADVVVEHEFRSQRIANAQLEPRSAIGLYDVETDVSTMVAGSQGVSRQHVALAGALRMPQDRLRVICPDVGGGFGPRSYLQPEQVAVVWAARRLHRPVRWTSSRSEAFYSDHQGRDSGGVVRLGFGADGKIRALSADCVYNLGAYAVGGYVPIANFSRILCSVYDIPHAYVRMRGVLTHTGLTGPFRGAGRPEAMYMLERLLDLAATRLGVDRIELRRRNLISHVPYTTALGLTYDSGAFLQNMDRALQLADWVGFPSRKSAARARGRLAGIGVANYVEAPVGAPHERVAATVRPDGVVELVAGTQSTGQGHETTFAQVAADQLQLRPDQIRLVTGDTDVVTSGGGTHSDRSMRLAGTLIVEACGKILARSRQKAAETLEVSPEDLVYADGVWSAVGTGRGVSLFEVSASAEATFTGRIPAHPTGAAVCEVELDPETLRVSVVRYTAVDDAGQPINPQILEGQIAGGIAQGVGQALGEHIQYEGATGQLLTSTFLDYTVPRAAWFPPLTLALTEDPTEGNPLRVKGGGEAGITPALAVVTNAVIDALGTTHVDMPLTSDRLWFALNP